MACLATNRTWLNRSPATPLWEAFFDGVAAEDTWDDDTSGGSFVIDNSLYCTGTGSLKYTGVPGTNYFRQNFAVAKDWSSAIGSLEFHAPAGTMTDGNYPGYAQALTSLNCFIFDGSSNFSSAEILNPNDDILEGWKSTQLNFDAFTGTANLADIRGIRIQMNWGAENGRILNFDNIKVYPKHTKGRIFWRFDDGYDDAYTHTKTANNYGVKTNLLIIGNTLGNSGIMTVSQVDELHAAGNAIINHCWGISGANSGSVGGWRHPDANELTLTDQDVKRADIHANAAFLIANGWPEHAYFIGVPGGKTHPLDEELIGNPCRALWYAGAGGPAQHGTTNRTIPRSSHEWGISGSYNFDTADTATVKSWIDGIEASKGDAAFYAHQSLVCDWEEVISYHQQKVEAGTMESGHADDLVTPISTRAIKHAANYGIGAGIPHGIGA